MEPKLSSQSPCSSKGFATLAIKPRDDEANKNIDMFEHPLLNPVVLDILLAQLSTPELKKARFVCRAWGDVGATVLGKRTFLRANKLFRFDGTKLSEPVAVADQLVRRLRISSNFFFDSSVPTQMRGQVITKVITDVAHQRTQELKVRLDQKKHMTAFLTGIRKLESTNLRHVSLKIDIEKSWGSKSPALEKLKDQPNLTSFKFIQKFGDDYYFTSRSSGYNHLVIQPFFQIWLDAAPNLTVLKISATSYLDLERCKSIKVFEFEFIHIPDIPLGDLNLTSVAGMLTQIKDSVVEMKLAYFTEEIHQHYQKEMLDLPVMPKLVTLAVECIYQIQNSLDETRLPKLKDLTLFKFHEVSDLTTRQKNPWRRHRGIQSVTMRMQGTCKWETFSETMVQLFPSVKEFHFTWFASYVPIDHVTKFLEPFQGWNLERADVVLLKKGEPASQTILAGLRSMATWKGEIKTATFYFNADRVDFTAHVDDFIRCSEGFANAGYFAG